MTDGIYSDVKQIFLDKFDNCNIINQSSVFKVEFNFEKDAEWFEKNICYPKHLDQNEYPINFLSNILSINNNEMLVYMLISSILM